MTRATSAYVEQGILSADGVELVCMLYQAAIQEVRDARSHLAAGKVPARCAAISKASDIVSELLSSLDMTAGGEIAGRLASLYPYLIRRLLEANLYKKDEPLAEVLELLITLSGAWQAISAKRSRQEEAIPSTHPAAFMDSYSGEAVAQSWSF